MSGMRICGRRALAGAEDLFVPSVAFTILNTPLLAIAAVAYVRIGRDDGCDPSTATETYRVGFLALLSSLVVCDLLVAFVSLRTKLCVPNPAAVRLLFLRGVLSVLLVLGAIVGTLLLSPVASDSCIDTDEHSSRTLNVAIVAVSWVAVALAAFYAACLPGPSASTSQDDAWVSRARFWLCTSCWSRAFYSDEDESAGSDALFGDVAKHFARTLDVEGLVPSDVVAGLILVKAVQIEDSQAGRRSFFVPADEDPAENKASLASRGTQPALDDGDWRRFEEGASMFRFAEGSYGWPMWGMTHLCRWATCALCRPCLSVPGTTAYTGRTCCNSSLKAFYLATGVPPEAVIEANLVSLVGQAVFYIAADRDTRSLVIACRGTLSVHDALVDIDATTVPFDEASYIAPDSRVHRGIYKTARAMLDGIESRGNMRSFLEANPDYKIVVVGHSLGAAIAAIITVALLERHPDTRCHTYGCPHIFTEDLARSERLRRAITSHVHNKDLVSRLSLHSTTQLKEEMIEAYKRSAKDSKFAIWNLDRRRRYSDLISPASFGTVESAAAGPRDVLVRIRQDSASDIHAAGDEDAADDAEPDPLFIPGRIMHMLRVRPKDAKPGCCFHTCCATEPKFTVYPADAKAFQQIMVDLTMGLDHMPNVYAEAFEKLLEQGRGLSEQH